jgi:hypothetical protein
MNEQSRDTGHSTEKTKGGFLCTVAVSALFIGFLCTVAVSALLIHDAMIYLKNCSLAVK